MVFDKFGNSERVAKTHLKPRVDRLGLGSGLGRVPHGFVNPRDPVPVPRALSVRMILTVYPCCDPFRSGRKPDEKKRKLQMREVFIIIIIKIHRTLKKSR